MNRNKKILITFNVKLHLLGEKVSKPHVLPNLRVCNVQTAIISVKMGLEQK